MLGDATGRVGLPTSSGTARDSHEILQQGSRNGGFFESFPFPRSARYESIFEVCVPRKFFEGLRRGAEWEDECVQRLFVVFGVSSHPLGYCGPFCPHTLILTGVRTARKPGQPFCPHAPVLTGVWTARKGGQGQSRAFSCRTAWPLSACWGGATFNKILRLGTICKGTPRVMKS